MIEAHGLRTASDGCYIKWDLRDKVQEIQWYNAAGKMQAVARGKLTAARLLLEIRTFLRVHGEQQLVLRGTGK